MGREREDAEREDFEIAVRRAPSSARRSRSPRFATPLFFRRLLLLGVAKKALGMIGDVDTRTFHAFNAELIAAFVRSGTDRALRRVVKDFADDLPGVALRFPSRLQK